MSRVLEEGLAAAGGWSNTRARGLKRVAGSGGGVEATGEERRMVRMVAMVAMMAMMAMMGRWRDSLESFFKAGSRGCSLGVA